MNRAADEGVPVLGVDGMLVEDKSTVSSPEHLADYSKDVAQGHGCWQDAESFIRVHMHLGLIFEITLGSDPVEAV